MFLPPTVELLTSIPEVVLTKNPVTLKFSASENMIESQGTKAKVILTWTAVAIANEYFDLLLAGTVVRFTCKVAPDRSGTQFQDNFLGYTLAQWVAVVATDLAKNYLLTRYYDITVLGTSITIEAKEPGSLYSTDFTAGPGIDCTADETNKNGTDMELRPFYFIVVLLYCRGEFVAELLLNADSEGLAEVDISRLLDTYLRNDFKWPESDSTFAFKREDFIADWYIHLGERYGEGEYRALQKYNTHRAIPSGISFMQRAKYNSDLSNFWAKLQYNKYFLSWAPLSRSIAPTEPAKLYFINHSNATALLLKAKLYTATTSQTITIETVSGVADNDVYEFVVSPGKVGYTGLDDMTLLKFEIWIENESNVRVSEIRTFVLDYTHYEQTRFFLFRNSLGAFEVLRATGLLEKAEGYSIEEATVKTSSDYTSKERENETIYKGEQQLFSLSIGWMDRYSSSDEYRNWLRDFSLSKEVYQVIGSTLKPVTIISTNLEHGKDRENSRGFSFEFSNAFTDEHFTKELTWNLLDSGFNSDFERAQ